MFMKKIYFSMLVHMVSLEGFKISGPAMDSKLKNFYKLMYLVAAAYYAYNLIRCAEIACPLSTHKIFDFVLP